MRDEVFARIPNPRLRVYAVWEPILATDAAESLPRAMRLLAADTRASHYWDPRVETGRQFTRTLGLPAFMPAWDVYLLYPSGVRWESAAPAPAFWMHQLGFMPFSEAARRFGKQGLDGPQFREELQKLMPSLPPNPSAVFPRREKYAIN